MKTSPPRRSGILGSGASGPARHSSSGRTSRGSPVPGGASARKRTRWLPATAARAGRAAASQTPVRAPDTPSTCVSPAPATCVLMSAPMAPSFATAPSAARKSGLFWARIATGVPAPTPSRPSRDPVHGPVVGPVGDRLVLELERDLAGDALGLRPDEGAEGVARALELGDGRLKVHRGRVPYQPGAGTRVNQARPLPRVGPPG